MGIINPIDASEMLKINPMTLQRLINATYAVLAENNVKLTPKLELLEMLLDDIEIYYLKDLEND